MNKPSQQQITQARQDFYGASYYESTGVDYRQAWGVLTLMGWHVNEKRNWVGPDGHEYTFRDDALNVALAALVLANKQEASV